MRYADRNDEWQVLLAEHGALEAILAHLKAQPVRDRAAWPAFRRLARRHQQHQDAWLDRYGEAA
jgi:hypothetical protein